MGMGNVSMMVAVSGVGASLISDLPQAKYFWGSLKT